MTIAMTEAQALDEAVLLLLRKTRRALRAAGLTDVFGRDIWARFPDGAKTALLAAERRADVNRARAGDPLALVWPVEADRDEQESDEPIATMGAGNVHNDDRETLQFADEAPDDDEDDDETGCEGHPDGPVMGETFYCDGSCR